MIKNECNRRSQAAWLSAIGEPTRLKILQFLATGEQTVSTIMMACDVEMVNVTYHLKVLKRATLISVVPDGAFKRCSLVGARAIGTVLELTHRSGAKVTVPLE